MPLSEELTAERVGAGMVVDADIVGGAGGPSHAVGDHFVGDLRRPFTQAGMWGLMRVEPPGGPETGLTALSAPFPAR